MRITVFPHLIQDEATRPNPYIQDMVRALAAQPDTEIANPPHRNPLLSLLKRQYQGDVFILNWFESIPDFNRGTLQSVIAIVWLLCLKARGKKIVWILHNKQPHNPRKRKLKNLLTSLVARCADLIITHASDGQDVIRQRYPRKLGKVHVLQHPTKDRIRLPEQPASTAVYDLLIWGHITEYKGVTEWMEYVKAHPEEHLRTCIVGSCSSDTLCHKLESIQSDDLTFIYRKPSFEELRQYMEQCRFVLVPYHSSSILSSGILMDSLSFGAKVIGPDTGSFKDYAHEQRLKVYTFRTFGDIRSIIDAHGNENASMTDYRNFLDENSWQSFAARLTGLIKEI